MMELQRLKVISSIIVHLEFVDQTHLGTPHVSKYIDTRRNPTSNNPIPLLSIIANKTSYLVRWRHIDVGTSNTIETRS